MKNKKASDIKWSASVKMDNGGTSKLEGDLISKVIMNRNRGVDFVDRAYALGDNPGTPMFNLPDDEQFGQNMSHKMAWGEDDNGQSWMYPTIMNPNNEAIQVPNQYADYISSEGYKNATGMNPYKAGGGGGARVVGSISPNAGPGGGGSGGTNCGVAGTAGVANTGGGGGGGGGAALGAAGGSGTVIVRAPGPAGPAISVSPGTNTKTTLPAPAGGCTVATFTVSGSIDIA